MAKKKVAVKRHRKVRTVDPETGRRVSKRVPLTAAQQRALETKEQAEEDAIAARRLEVQNSRAARQALLQHMPSPAGPGDMANKITDIINYLRLKFPEDNPS